MNPDGQHVLELVLMSVSSTALLIVGFFLKDVFKDWKEMKKYYHEFKGDTNVRLVRLDTNNDIQQ